MIYVYSHPSDIQLEFCKGIDWERVSGDPGRSLGEMRLGSLVDVELGIMDFKVLGVRK